MYMKIIRLSVQCVLVAVFFSYICAQIVVVNDPMQWVTLRSDSIVVRMQIDTANVPEKKVGLQLYSVNHNTKRSLARKVFTVDDYSHEFGFGTIGKELIGGQDYLQLEWDIPGKEVKGEVYPFGIAADYILMVDNIEGFKKVTTTVDSSTIESIQEKTTHLIAGEHSFGAVWNDTYFILLYKKAEESAGTITWCFDGENGKKAFLAYSDRFVSYSADNDSLFSYHFKRSVYTDSIHYEKTDWANDIDIVSTKNTIALRIPWYDLAVIPFDGRAMGFAVFVADKNGNAQASIPTKARETIPATWGNVAVVAP
jgi:hypothetical protein